jgi:ribonuclease D
MSGIPNHRIWPNRFPEADARLKAARPAIAELAEKLSIPAENLLTPDYLRAICWQPPENLSVESLSEQLSTLGARQWQIEIVADAILNALTAEPISAETSEAD